MGNGAWMNCAALREVQWDAALTKIPASTFEHCTALTQIELTDGIVEIGARAFSGNESLTNVTLPRTVRRIESAAFEGCSALTDILLWPDVEEIAADAFANCENLTIRGWKGSAAEKAATSQGMNFAAADQEISYTLNAAQDGYLVSGCDETRYCWCFRLCITGCPWSVLRKRLCKLQVPARSARGSGKCVFAGL